MDNGKPAPALSIFLLFFLLTPISPACRKLTAVECKAAKVAASHYNVTTFGFDVVGLGFDLTTMKTKDMVLDMNSWEDTNGNCTVCMNTLLEGSPVQFLPLAITEWNITNDRCRYHKYDVPSTIVDLVLKEYSYVGPSKLWNGNLSLNWKSRYPVTLWGPEQYRLYYFVGTRSEIMKYARTRSITDRGTFFHYEIKCKKYRVRTRENPPISEEFKESLKKLPQNYSDAAFHLSMDLIKTYGTHYLVEAELGGALRSAVNIRYCKIGLAGFNMNEVRECLINYIRSALGMSTNNDPTCVRLRSLVEDCRSDFWGGDEPIDLCQMGGKAENYLKWQAALSIFPGLITCKIKPIHLLLDEQDPRRQYLGEVLHQYIYLKSMHLACTNHCPSNTPNFHTVCACTCSDDGLVKDDCCPKQIGISRVTVWIHSARGLPGDWLSEADTAIEVELFGVTMTTGYVWNNNYPVFNKQFDFGIVPLLHRANTFYVTAKEWNPYPWGEVITDRFSVEFGAGERQNKVHSLSPGLLSFSYHVVCGPKLTGYNCRDYKPQATTFSHNFDFRKDYE